MNFSALNFVNENALPIYYLHKDLDKADVLIYNMNKTRSYDNFEEYRNITKYSRTDEHLRRYMNFLYRECKIK